MEIVRLDCIRALKRRLGEDASPEGLTRVLQDARSGRAGPLGDGQTDGSAPQLSMRDRNRVVRCQGEIGIVSLDCIRALKRRLGEDASPEGLTRVLQDARSGRAGPLG